MTWRPDTIRSGARDDTPRFALVLFCMPLVYPLFSLALGRTFPMMTSPVMPCSVAVFTVALMLAFSVAGEYRVGDLSLSDLGR